MKKTIFALALGVIAGVGAYYMAPDVKSVSAEETSTSTTTTTKDCDGSMMRNGPGGLGARGEVGETHQLIADQLGISEDKLDSLLDEGYTLDEIISEQGGDREAIKSLLVDNMTENIEEHAIDDDRAEEMLSNVDNRVESILNHERGSGPMEGFGNGQGRRMGMGQD